MRLKDKVIIITGSTMGIGKAIAIKFVSEGAKVVVHGLEKELAENLRKMLGNENCIFHIEDLSNSGCSDRLVSIAIKKWKKLFEPYGIHEFQMGFAGVDINPLENGKICLIGLSPDSQRYFDHHHSDNDVYEEVNKRELELGVAAMTALVFLIDKYWVM